MDYQSQSTRFTDGSFRGGDETLVMILYVAGKKMKIVDCSLGTKDVDAPNYGGGRWYCAQNGM
jgi:hypothetical protein